jgi:hypothetical protein
VGYNSVAVNHLSLQYLGVPVTAVTLTGAAFNPTGNTVQMAFMPQATQSPQTSDWQAAIWGTNTSNVLQPYTAFCLIGPGGTIQLGTGTYVIWVKVQGNPEIPVMTAPMQLEIT